MYIKPPEIKEAGSSATLIDGNSWVVVGILFIVITIIMALFMRGGEKDE